MDTIEEELKNHSQQQKLTQFSQLALVETELTSLLNNCVMLVAESLQIESCQIFKQLSDCDDLILQTGVNRAKGRTNYIFIPPDDTIYKPNEINDGISVVIHGKKQPFGVLKVKFNNQENLLNDNFYFLQSIANILAIAIERQQTEEALKKTEERYSLAVLVARATNDVLWDWDLVTNQVCWNPSVETLFGYTIEQIQPDIVWWRERIHPEERQRIAADMRTVIDSGKQFWSNEYRFLRRDGTYIYIFDRGYVVHNQKGKPVRMIGAMMDMSDRKRSQAELQRQNLRSQLFANITLKIRQSLQIDEILQTSVTEVQKLLQADRVLILQLHKNGLFEAVKEAVVPGLPIILGQNITHAYFGENDITKYHQGEISSITNIEQAQIKPDYIKFLQRFGVKAHLVVPIFIKNQIWGLLIAHQCLHPRQWTNWEIGLLRQLADQISIALAQSLILEQETHQRQELIRSNEELQQFAFIASHDLQEPLRKIQTFSDRLQLTCGDALNEQGRDYLARMHNATQRMQTLIEDLLTLSRVTTKAQPFIMVNLAQITQEVLSDLEVRIQHTQGHIEVGVLPIIKADPLQMRQLFQNLIGNALKFHRPNEPPIVKIYSQFLNNPSDNSAVTEEVCQIIVEDNGIGFSEKYLDRIFNVFQRLHSRSEYEGTGIGLAICRKITERHQGSITAQSYPGKGSKFIIKLPINSHL
ncbi:GAF domain-containing protein [Cronbergia sp. UHCC 0137]|uniref:sensor histidine kinase n=1 Tax=Cronbergia sp. UHCC 0137 TaxID=3110239 RepID=UPI002B1EB2D6|nr:GAF domain-containing protein [Cronbergia sp. UHCC 0137]MEA5616961.1 GAF domain-containing protein [Cronbergia sp. UHCC 0137]